MRPNTPQAEFDAKIAVVSDIDWARLAAFVDGEGSLSIQKHGQNLRLAIGNVSPLLMSWLRDTFTGAIYNKKPSQCCRRIVMQWIQLDSRAEELIRRMYPYLIIKRAQAELALQYRELRKGSSRGWRNTAEDLEIRESYRETMKSLNAGTALSVKSGDGKCR